MSITIHQAIYGDNQGAYSLLDSSLDNETANSICNVTDLLDRPSSGHLTEAIFRGFALKGYYLFIKTFPDTDPAVRSGRVLSHVLLIKIEDIVICDDLGPIFDNFIHTADKEYKVGIINYISNPDDRPAKITSGTRASRVVNELIDCDHIAWIGEKDYIATLKALWFGFPSTLRHKLNIGAAFDPKKLSKELINFVYVFEGNESKWKKSQCSLICENHNGSIDSLAAYYLAGDTANTKELLATLQAFSICVTSLEDIDALIILSNTYLSLPNTEFSSLISLCDLISTYSPAPKKAVNEKIYVLNCLAERIQGASPRELIALKNPNWSGFGDVSLLLGEAFSNRLEHIVKNSGFHNAISEIVVSALSLDTPGEWWVDTVISTLGTAFESWTSVYAQAVWQWILADNRILTKLESYIPESTDVERDLTQAWRAPCLELAIQLQELATKRSWYNLYALSILSYHPAHECIELQLKLDIDEDHLAALETIVSKIDDVEFLSIALGSTDYRLIKLAAHKVCKHPSLLEQFDDSNVNWLGICTESISLGIDVLQHISSPETLTYKLFDQVIDGVTLNENVFSLLSKSKFNDLSTYPQRALIWRHFDADSKNSFLIPTAIGCIKLVDKKVTTLTSLESEITNIINDNSFMKQVVPNVLISLSMKIDLFKRFRKIGEDNCCFLIEQCKFSITDSKSLGMHILDRKWRKAAQLCKDLNKSQGRSDLQVAAKLCAPLLKSSLFDRLFGISNFNNNTLLNLREHHFEVALSFPGEKRAYVKEVVDNLLKTLYREEVFYDNHFKSQIAQPNADVILQNVYRNNSKLLVVFICSEYDQKQWCGLEWRAIREVIKHKNDQQIMPIRFDDQEIEGLFSIDGYIDANDHNEEEVARLILERLAVLINTPTKEAVLYKGDND